MPLRSGGRYVRKEGAKEAKLVEKPTRDHPKGNAPRDAKGNRLDHPEALAPTPKAAAKAADPKPTTKEG